MSFDPATLTGNWNYPTAMRFGPGRIAELPEACQSLGMTRPLLVTDPGLAGLPMVADALTTKTQRTFCLRALRALTLFVSFGSS